jgi:hypothetical protein
LSGWEPFCVALADHPGSPSIITSIVDNTMVATAMMRAMDMGVAPVVGVATNWIQVRSMTQRKSSHAPAHAVDPKSLQLK